MNRFVRFADMTEVKLSLQLNPIDLFIVARVRSRTSKGITDLL